MISVIVPVYNEEAVVASSLESISKELEGFVEHEIIAVNDGSTDNSLAAMQKLKIKNLSILNHVENLGYGKALFDGILTAKYDCIAIIDSDGSYPASQIRKLCEFYPKYDMVVGARTGKEYKKGIFKRPARTVFNFLVEYACGRKVPDVNSGLRIFRKDAILKFKDSLCLGFSFTTTITLIFFLNQYYVKYVPIEYFKREGKSKVNHVRDSLRAGQIIVQTILYYNPVKLLLLMALLNFIFGAVAGILNHLFFKIGVISIFSAICMASFVPLLCVGFIADQLKQIYKSVKEIKN